MAKVTRFNYYKDSKGGFIYVSASLGILVRLDGADSLLQQFSSEVGLQHYYGSRLILNQFVAWLRLQSGRSQADG